jgi:hypothetical protein
MFQRDQPLLKIQVHEVLCPKIPTSSLNLLKEGHQSQGVLDLILQGEHPERATVVEMKTLHLASRHPKCFWTNRKTDAAIAIVTHPGRSNINNNHSKMTYEDHTRRGPVRGATTAMVTAGRI